MDLICREYTAEDFLRELETGRLRAADRDASGKWCVRSEVKEGILQLFRQSPTEELASGVFGFRDRRWLFPPTRPPAGVRLVPGGSAIRRGAFVASGVVIMPPSYVNVGAFVDEGSMIDSHVLVGSCAQIGKGVHLSAGVQIGGVLEPVGSLPVIVEDHAFIGGLCGIFEGVFVGAHAVLATGVTLTATKPLYDIVRQLRIEPQDGRLCIPPGAVVISGSRALSDPCSIQHGLTADVNLIVKYRDAGTEAKVVLENALR